MYVRRTAYKSGKAERQEWDNTRGNAEICPRAVAMDNKIGKKGEGGVSERDKSDGNSNVIENKGKSNTTPPTTSGKLKKEEQEGQKEIEEREREREQKETNKHKVTKWGAKDMNRQDNRQRNGREIESKRQNNNRSMQT